MSADLLNAIAVYSNTLNEEATFQGTTLSLRSETTLSLYFESSKTLDFACEGMTVETVKNGKYQVARIRGINSGNLQDSYELYVKNHETGALFGTIVYSPMTYCRNVLSDTNQPEALQNVCKALYLYAQEAGNYFS